LGCILELKAQRLQSENDVIFHARKPKDLPTLLAAQVLARLKEVSLPTPSELWTTEVWLIFIDFSAIFVLFCGLYSFLSSSKYTDQHRLT